MTLANPLHEQVALKRFIDDVANEVVEAKLISPLGGIFTPLAVSKMSADLVMSMAGESEESRAQRGQLAKQLDVLAKGSDTCKRFIGVRLLGKKAPCLFCFARCLPIYSGGADNNTTHSMSGSNNEPVVGADDDATRSGHASNSDFDEGPEAMFEEDA